MNDVEATFVANVDLEHLGQQPPSLFLSVDRDC